MDVGAVPLYPTGIVRFEHALYVSGCPRPTKELPYGPDDATGGLFRVGIGDGAPATLLTRCYRPRILAVDAAFTWTWDGLLRRAARSGGEEVTLPFSMAHWLAVDGDDLFVAGLAIHGHGRRAAIVGDWDADGFVTFADDGASRRVVVRGAHVYYDAFVYPHPERGCRIFRRPRRGGPAELLAEVDREIIDLGVVGDDVVLGAKDGPLLRVPCAGGRVEAIAGTACGGRFATGGGRIGWFDEDGRRLCLVEGRAPVRRIALAPDRAASGPESLLLEESVAFYGTREPDASGHHAIVRVPVG